MANEQNLIPFGTRSESEERAMQSKGGINSGITRRRKKTLKQAIEFAMSLPVTNPILQDEMQAMGIDTDDADNQMAVICGLMQKAMFGNEKAAKVLFDNMDDSNTSTAEQTEAHNSLIDAIRMRNNED